MWRWYCRPISSVGLYDLSSPSKPTSAATQGGHSAPVKISMTTARSALAFFRPAKVSGLNGGTVLWYSSSSLASNSLTLARVVSARSILPASRADRASIPLMEARASSGASAGSAASAARASSVASPAKALLSWMPLTPACGYLSSIPTRKARRRWSSFQRACGPRPRTCRPCRPRQGWLHKRSRYTAGRRSRESRPAAWPPWPWDRPRAWPRSVWSGWLGSIGARP